MSLGRVEAARKCDFFLTRACPVDISARAIAYEHREDGRKVRWSSPLFGCVGKVGGQWGLLHHLSHALLSTDR